MWKYRIFIILSKREFSLLLVGRIMAPVFPCCYNSNIYPIKKCYYKNLDILYHVLNVLNYIFLVCEEKYGPIAGTAQQYTKEKKLIGEQKEEMEDIASTLEGMGLKDKDYCTSIPKGSVEYFHGNEISPMGAEMLEKKFEIKKKPVDLDSGILAIYHVHLVLSSS